jgi:hypothetical protein
MQQKCNNLSQSTNWITGNATINSGIVINVNNSCYRILKPYYFVLHLKIIISNTYINKTQAERFANPSVISSLIILTTYFSFTLILRFIGRWLLLEFTVEVSVHHRMGPVSKPKLLGCCAVCHPLSIPVNCCFHERATTSRLLCVCFVSPHPPTHNPIK